jgi:hypothetical protein
MATDIDNPYAPPALEAAVPARPSGWRVVPAAASFLVGVVSFGVGLVAVAMMTYALWTHRPTTVTLGGMIAACTMYLGFGSLWMLAGWCYWKRRYYRGLIATGIGALIPGVLFAILGV